MIDKKDLFVRYGESGIATRTYLRIKLKICPLIRLETLFPRQGRIVDLGCGNGLFPNILSLGSEERQIIGIDLDLKKLAIADQTKSGAAPIDYQPGNVVEVDYPEADVFSLVDVLYLIPYEKQEVILRKCARALSPGGTLVIKEMDMRPRWKYVWNNIQETLAVKIIGFTLGERFFFRSSSDFQSLLTALGFEVKTVAMDKGYWYPHIAYVCTR
ncbi:MAG: class I SAM-dependent methyltransferase [Candidatus Aminicenantes bacterium]|nr:class I SAM-dependent methyltransferase [Candidatus Aminicenantes bacterium]